MRLATFALGALLALSATAAAKMHAGPNVMPGGERLRSPDHGSSIDNPALAGLYSFRKVKAAYTGPSARIRRTSDNAQQDINFAGVGVDSDFDAAFASAFCAATTCYLAIWYDQSGNLRDIIQTANTATSQPQLVFGCGDGGRPCLEMTQVSQTLTSGNWAVSSPVSLNRISARLLGAGSCVVSTNSSVGSRIIDVNPLGHSLNGAAGGIVVPTGDNNWHSMVGVINDASSYLSDNGAVTTGTVTANVTAGGMTLAGSNTATCRFVEFIAWSGYALSPSEANALIASQMAHWRP
jgi:hypothetical protein